MKVLVTGGTGYIGSHTCVELLNHGDEVVIVDNLYNSKREVVDRIASICGKSPVFYEVDVTDKAAVSRIFSQYQIVAIVAQGDLAALPDCLVGRKMDQDRKSVV